jgi:hypothetical protein
MMNTMSISTTSGSILRKPTSVILNPPSSMQHKDHSRSILKLSLVVDPHHHNNDNNNSTNDATLSTADSVMTLPVETAPTTQHRRRRPEVTFDSVQIRYYPMILGDHPACSIGPPVTLGWEYTTHNNNNSINDNADNAKEDETTSGDGTIDINTYELQRGPRRRLRHLVMNYYRRRNVLLQAGYNEADLRQAERQVARHQRQRTTTRWCMPVSRVQEVVQGAARSVTSMRIKPKQQQAPPTFDVYSV